MIRYLASAGDRTTVPRDAPPLEDIYHFGIDGHRGGELPVLATTEHHFDRPDLPLVVLVHGAMDRSRSFRRVVDHLATTES
jgi:hypothetical protein